MSDPIAVSQNRRKRRRRTRKEDRLTLAREGSEAFLDRFDEDDEDEEEELAKGKDLLVSASILLISCTKNLSSSICSTVLKYSRSRCALLFLSYSAAQSFSL